MKKLTPKQIFNKIVIIGSGISFFWFSGASVVKMLTQPATPPNQSQSQQLSPEARLQQEINGYEIVLAKEPNNIFALERLLELNLQNKDLQKALPLAEKLVSIDPKNQRYQEALKNIKQGLAQEKPTNTQQ